MNGLKTAILLGLLSGLVLLIGQLMGGRSGLILGLGIAIAMNVGSYWASDKIALKMAQAEPVTPEQAPDLYEIVERLAAVAKQPMPRLYVSPSPQPNAFATGRSPKHAAVCVNRGLIPLLTKDEMEGVLAHELSHVYNRDILIGTIAATLASVVTFAARMGFYFGGRSRQNGVGVIGSLLMVFLAPIAATIIQLAITRSRETAADASGAMLCQKPLALANALLKLQGRNNELLARNQLQASPAETSPSFASLYISAPFNGQFVNKLFSTHPDTDTRVENLKSIARQMGVAQ
ncbi:M48 family metalloprotease [Stomatohabitans albus]|uniref:M48 family metalloprotease n=1 Tax=Stomatohabitans albus TaxID=3110766 RepID=UPI00300CFC1A